MNVQFREFDPFNCWIWLHFSDVLNQGEKSYIDGLFDSWYVLGRLGGFNAENLQAHEEGSDLNWMHYDNEEGTSTLPSLMHNVGQLEYQSYWGRCWIDFGTADALALDVLLNALRQVDNDIVQIEEVFIGGVNDDWAVEDHPDAIFKQSD
tara:strand:+ start:503 stop:952 length:450 start_codon:yes stop_codon:yes gene_type:complete